MSPTDHPSSTDRPLISVVIPAFNATATIRKCLTSLGKQTWPAELLEVVIVDDGSTDGTPEACKGYEGVRVLVQENAGPSAARNRGLSEARGSLIAFTDSDCIVAESWLERLAESLDDPSVAAVGGRQRCPADAVPFMQDVHGVLSMMGFLGGYTKTGAARVETGHNPSCNAMYRRCDLIRVGGFREGMFPGEDVDLDRRLQQAIEGRRILYDPTAVVYHYRPTSHRGWWKMMWRYGYSSAHNVRIHGAFRLLHHIPWVMAGLAVAWLLLVIAAPPLGLLLGGLPIVLLVALAVGRSPRIPWKRKLRRARLLGEMLAAFPLGFFQGWWVERTTRDRT